MDNDQIEPLAHSSGEAPVHADLSVPEAQVEVEGDGTPAANRKRRRGSRGGRNRKRPATADDGTVDDDDAADDDVVDDEVVDDEAVVEAVVETAARRPRRDVRPELPERISEGRPSSVEAADQALVRKPQIGDTRPAPVRPPARRTRRRRLVLDVNRNRRRRPHPSRRTQPGRPSGAVAAVRPNRPRCSTPRRSSAAAVGSATAGRSAAT